MANISDNTRDQYLSSAMNSVEKCAQRVAQFFEAGEDRDQTISSLYKVMEGYCMLETRAKSCAECLLTTQNIDRSENTLTFQQLFDAAMEEKLSKVADMKKHAKYLRFDKAVKSVIKDVGEDETDDDDDDLRVTDAEVNSIDPITQQTMVSPVKNKICGHSYEKSSILQLMKHKKRQRCPYVGCPNRSEFTADDLEEDIDLKQILKTTTNTTLSTW